jgi:membrane associated rhomboid family serine protease
MRYDTRYRSRSSLFNWSFPTGVKWLIISNVAVYIIYFFGSMMRGEPIFENLVLMPSAVIHGAVWQLVTYLFLHSLSSFWHILFNMLTLWMFGAPIEETWGTRRFVQYYFLCGVGAGVCVVVANLLFGDPHQRVIGASGAIFGLLLAYGMLFPNQTVLFSFLFPMKAKYMVMIFGVLEFMSSFQGGNAVSNLAHLGGMIFGFIYMKTQFGTRSRVRLGPKEVRLSLADRWKEYKLQRARKKFKIYMKKHGSGGSGNDPWVN